MSAPVKLAFLPAARNIPLCILPFIGMQVNLGRDLPFHDILSVCWLFFVFVPVKELKCPLSRISTQIPAKKLNICQLKRSVRTAIPAGSCTRCSSLISYYLCYVTGSPLKAYAPRLASFTSAGTTTSVLNGVQILLYLCREQFWLSCSYKAEEELCWPDVMKGTL